MTAVPDRPRGGRLGELLEAVKFQHSIFALPFAYLGMVLAAGGWPGWDKLLLITVAMVAARTLAMGANRLIDARIDARNPRTAGRALPAGRLRSAEMLALVVGSAILFFGAAALLNPLALALAPLAVVIVVGYSYTKRFTWLCHGVLGIADAIAPAGGWIAVTGSFGWEPLLLVAIVATWIGGFDVIYSCQDVDFDRANRLQSIPARFGIATGLTVARLCHLVTALGLVALGPVAGLGPLYYLGAAIAIGLLAYENAIVKPDDLSRLDTAFFNVNGYIAVIVFMAVLGGLWWRPAG